MKDSDIISISSCATFQSLGDGAVILRTDSGQIYTCNETTEAFLKIVDGRHTFGEILKRLVAAFDIDQDTLTADISSLADDLIEQGIIVAA